MTMTIEPSDFPNGHGQNFDNNFNEFQIQKILNCRDGQEQIWFDHVDHRTSIWLNGQKRGHWTPLPKFPIHFK